MADGLGVMAAFAALVVVAMATFLRELRINGRKGPLKPPENRAAKKAREIIETTAQERMDAIGAGLNGSDPTGAVADAANRASKRRRR